MIAKTIHYTDYDGNERDEEFYFNLTQSEIVGMDLEFKGGMIANLNALLNDQDGNKLNEFFSKFILRSVGKKSPDGRRFIKNDEIREDFRQTPAYDQLFMSLITNADEAAAFMNGVIPQVKDK